MKRKKEDQDVETICKLHTVKVNSETIHWKELEEGQMKLIKSIVSRFRTRSAAKEMVVDEVSYALENKDIVGLYKREWKFIVEALKQKFDKKGTRNKEEIEYLIRVLERDIAMEMKPPKGR